MTRSMSSRPSLVSLKACSAIADALRRESETVSTHRPTPCLEDIVSTACWALEASRIPSSSVTCWLRVVDAAGSPRGAPADTADAAGTEGVRARGAEPAVVGAAAALAESPSSPRTAVVARPERAIWCQGRGSGDCWFFIGVIVPVGRGCEQVVSPQAARVSWEACVEGCTPRRPVLPMAGGRRLCGAGRHA